MVGNIAAISWQDSKFPHIRVYESDGTIVTEKCFDGSSSWLTGQLSVPGSSVTATSWNYTGQPTQIRVYVSNNGKIIEHCYDGQEWYTGATLGNGIEATATTYLSDDGKTLHIRVYAREANNTITEYCFDSNKNVWEKGIYPSYALA